MRPDAGRPPGEHPEGRSILAGSDDNTKCTRSHDTAQGTLPGLAYRPLPSSPHTPAPRPPKRRPAALTDPATSWQAGRPDTHRKRVSRSRLRQAVHEAHRAHPEGLTDDQVAELLPGEDKGSIAKRRGDLVADGLLIDSGATRPTRRGCAAIVWQVAP